MEVHQLRYAVAVADTGSFTAAAAALHVSQSGVSAQVGRLEHDLGVRLFERHTRGVDLTDAGTLLLERARATLEAADNVTLVTVPGAVFLLPDEAPDQTAAVIATALSTLD